ncbi:TonB-dependent receptor [uncultured Draconibacterium sp.]|uniref:SusC/RagA family TonB-linked outer membrane protein n=1 Tax=uncultured Draconibacterium sp. TaxID=1573823 RepID=UPI0029C72A5A|nr:TonB-dependent receptor [uncultured Draconibacterium sp.]
MKKSILLLLIVLCTSIVGMAQKSISGIVTDSNKEPMPGVTVVFKNTTTGTVTGMDGDYKLNVPDNASILVFSFIGMETKEVGINGQTVLNVQLESAVTELDEVIAIGYGTVRKRDLTGSVSNIRSEEITQSQSVNVMNAMQGRMSGVQISSESGEPGSGINIRIRGANSIVGGSTPLFVIDGVQIDVNKDEVASSGSTTGTMDPLSSLNPADIESIDVLKDASATAIYGSRGANGVVIVTTKSGKDGKSSLEYNGTFALSEASKKLDVLSADDYYDYQVLRNRESFYMMDTNDDGEYDTPRDFSTIKSHNWQDEALRTAQSQQHMISASGGNKKSNYSASVSYLSQEGLIKKNDFDRYNFRVKLNHIQSDKLKLGFNLNNAFSELTGAANNGGPNNFQGPVQLLVLGNPWEIIDEDIEDAGQEYLSPLALIERADKTTRLFRSLASLDLEYKITKGLTYKGMLGGTYSKSKLKEYYGTNTNWGVVWGGRAAITEVGTYSYSHSSQLNFVKTFNEKHQFSAMAAFEVNHYNYEHFRNQVASFADESTGVNDISKGAVNLEYSSSRWSTNRLSYLGRVNYTFNDKYLLTASLRADGSDKFGANNRWGYFPSGAFAWRMSEESFIKDVEKISNLKLRLSYGKTGNERIPAYSYFAQMANAYYASDDNLMFGMAPGSLESPDLQWETTTQYNAGMDIGFFKNRLNINVDYYLKQTRDMLLNAPIASQSGFKSQWLNIGSLDNSGLELNISSVNVQKKDFSWESNFNISFNKNEVLDIGGAQFIPVTIPTGWITSAGRVIVGEPIGTMYGYESNGIYQIDEFNWQNNSDPSIAHEDRTYTLKEGGLPFTSGTAVPGAQKYKDLSGPDGVPDGVVDDTYDRTIIGNSAPKHMGGLNNSFTYKNFDLGVFFQWSYGNEIYNAAKYREAGTQSWMNIRQDYYENYWSESNPSNEYPGLGQISSAISSYYVEDGSYLRLKTVSLGYTLPSDILTGTGLSYVKFFVTGQNLITWTNYSGFDPEVNSNNPLLPGFERFSYPRPRTVTFGVNVKF